MSESIGFTEEETKAAAKSAEFDADRQSQLRDDFVSTFSTAPGERVFEHLYVSCRQNKPTYSKGQDVTHTAYLEGRRSVVLEIMAFLTLDDMTIIDRARNRALANRR